MKLFNSLCQPAQFYLVISLVSFALVLIQNMGSTNQFKLGNFSTQHDNPAQILVMNALYIVVWTWMLNWICTINPKISWVIVLLPFVLMFVAFGMVLLR